MHVYTKDFKEDSTVGVRRVSPGQNWSNRFDRFCSGIPEQRLHHGKSLKVSTRQKNGECVGIGGQNRFENRLLGREYINP